VANNLYDGVLVDAPCSGSGTWRRRPFLRHQTNPKVIEGFARTQAKILDQASDRVRPGGRLVYATCSLCRSENEDVIRAFLDDHEEFEPDPIPNRLNLVEMGPGRFHILPERLNGDSFYRATLRRKQPDSTGNAGHRQYLEPGQSEGFIPNSPVS
jgi:16S rRNA (cytosine967-C5)-methyltransferase